MPRQFSPRPDAGRTSPEAASPSPVTLPALAAPLLRLQAHQSDRAAEARLVAAVEDQAETLRRRPSGPERDHDFARLRGAVTELSAAMVAKGAVVGGNLARLPERLATWAAEGQRATRDGVAAPVTRGRSSSRTLEAGSARPVAASTGAALGPPLQRTRGRAGRPRTQADTPRRAPPLPGTPLAALLGGPKATRTLALGKHRLDHDETAVFLPMLHDARTGQMVRARASLLALAGGEVLLLTNMVAHGAFGKLRPALVLHSGKEVALKELRRERSRRPHEPSRLMRNKTSAPHDSRDRQAYDTAAKEEFDLMGRFGGRARSLAMHQTHKSNFIVMEAMDGDLALPFKRARPLRRAALARTLGPALLRELAGMHAQGYLHVDVKLENALLHLADGEVSLADFGASQRLRNGVVSLPRNRSTHPAPEATVRQARPTPRPAPASSYFSDSEDEQPMLRLTPAADVWSAAVTMLMMLDYGNGGVRAFDYNVFSSAAYRVWYAQAVPNGRDFNLTFLANSGEDPFTAMVLRCIQADPDFVQALLLGPLHPDPVRRPTAAQLADALSQDLPPTAEHTREVTEARAERAERQASAEVGLLRAGLRALRADLVGHYPQLLHLNLGFR